MVTAEEWARVQEIERRYHEQKDPAQILAINMAYWERILGALPAAGVVIAPATRVLDVGCGGAGILLGVKDGIKTGVDPLMAYYLEKFPFLKEAPVRWVAGTAEEFAADERFDVVFSVNALDHVFDPRRSALNLERLLAPGGKLVLVLTVHLTRFFRGYFARLYPWVDPPHPHQIHRDDVAGYFPGLTLTHLSDIDHLWLDLEGSRCALQTFLLTPAVGTREEARTAMERWL